METVQLSASIIISRKGQGGVNGYILRTKASNGDTKVSNLHPKLSNGHTKPFANVTIAYRDYKSS